MLARNLLYTGVTRGKQLGVLIGQPKACALAVRKVRAMRRLTNLAARLRQQGARGAAPLWRASVCPALTALPPAPRRVMRGAGHLVRPRGVPGARGSDQPRTKWPALPHRHTSPRWPRGI